MDDAFDALVVGSGISALTFSLEAAQRGHRICVVTKRLAEEANTAYAQGGIAAVLSPTDSLAAHVHDTLRAGAGLCQRSVVEQIVEDGPQVVRRLVEHGVRFDQRTGTNTHNSTKVEYDLGREGGHSHRRVLHAGDITGAEVMRGLLEALRAKENVTIYEHCCAVDLITSWGVEGVEFSSRNYPPLVNRILGAYVFDEQGGEVRTLLAKTVLLATGGASKVYLYTSNPDIATGDGVAMAWRAGASVANMEFIQFHPTCLFHPKAKSFLISEALRGEGGILRRADGTQFMRHYHEMSELAPRDIVARAIDNELKRTGQECVFLDMTHLDSMFLKARFPNIYTTCLAYGFDLVKDPIPVVPAAHYVCGGVRCNIDGETDISGLFVAGEVSCTGMHGANRLASNSLLEGAVTGHRAARSAEKYISQPYHSSMHTVRSWNSGKAVPSDELVVITQCWDEIRRFMWNYVGIVRSNRRLIRAYNRIDTLREEIREFYWQALVTRDLLELRNICTVAELIVRCALRRRESRGLHYTIDYPDIVSGLPSDTILNRNDLLE
ncbi:MAG: L-aspartate oxidase [Myxococcales bacterium]|nr:L-aspartate oxidase [Myxococcales bacterium]